MIGTVLVLENTLGINVWYNWNLDHRSVKNRMGGLQIRVYFFSRT